MTTIGTVRIPAAVVAHFEQFALAAAAAGHRRYSARGVLERLRWHAAIEKRGAYRLNNNWSPVLARWFNTKHPELPSFFELRDWQR